jgi:hypothetical protein
MAACRSAGRASIPASRARTPAAERVQPNRPSPVPHRAASPYPAFPQTEALWTGPSGVMALLTGSPQSGLPTAAGMASALQETTDPGTNGPGTSGPGASGPGPADSGTTDLPSAHRDTTDPGRNGPGTTGPATTALAAARPGATGPGTTGLGTADPEAAHPEIAHPATTGPAAAHSGMTEPGTTGLRASGPGTTGLAEALPGMADSWMTGPERTVRKPALGVLARTRRLQLGLPAAASPGPWWRARATSARTALARTALSQAGPLRVASVASGPGHRFQARRPLDVGP